MPKEAAIVRKILQNARARGAYALKVHGGPYTDAGTPDVLLCFRGQFVALEVKRPGQRATALQEHRLAQIRDAGGHAHVVHSWPVVAAILDQIQLESEIISL